MTEILCALASVVAGTVAGCLVACVPALHIYNVMGFGMIGLCSLDRGVPPVFAVPFVTGLIVGWAMANTIPSVFLAAPDESALLMVLPGQKYAMAGRGIEAVMLTAVGGLAGAFVLVLLAGPLAPLVVPTVHAVFRRHLHWVLWSVIVFLLMSEWPRAGVRGPGGWKKFAEGWASLSAGLLTFALSGLLGFILRYRSPMPLEAAFQDMMPAFAGLFAMPWLILNIVSRVELPRQQLAMAKVVVPMRPAFVGACAGTLGGAFAAFFPGVTGGIGALFAGHATAQRDDRVFLVSQGASKLVYYTGAFLLLFVPGLNLSRGTGAWLLQGLYVPHSAGDYFMALASVAVAGAVAFLLMAPLARGMVAVVGRAGCRPVSWLALALIALIVAAATGPMGLLVMAVSTGIGLIPLLFHSRRLNCLGVILLPMACGMSGIAPAVAARLGLL